MPLVPFPPLQSPHQPLFLYFILSTFHPRSRKKNPSFLHHRTSNRLAYPTLPLPLLSQQTTLEREMETEAFPYRFYRGIRLYWRRRKYQRVDGSGSGKKAMRVARLGSGRGGSRRAWRIRPLFRVRIKIPSPWRLLARLRDAYVDAMLGMAAKGSALGPPNRAEALCDKRIPTSRPVRVEAGSYFEQRLMLEIYKSLAATGELAGI